MSERRILLEPEFCESIDEKLAKDRASRCRRSVFHTFSRRESLSSHKPYLLGSP